MSEFSRVMKYARTSLAVGVASIAVGAYQNNNYQENMIACHTELTDEKQNKECTARVETGHDGTSMSLIGAAAILYGMAYGVASASKTPTSLEDYRSRRIIDRELNAAGQKEA